MMSYSFLYFEGRKTLDCGLQKMKSGKKNKTAIRRERLYKKNKTA